MTTETRGEAMADPIISRACHEVAGKPYQSASTGLALPHPDHGEVRPEPPTVSILIPAHDAAARLPRTVRSALAQSASALEVIVVDDASRDATYAIAMALAEQEPRIRVLRSAVNLGPAGARNLALGAARGEWIALLDSDDAFLPGRLARLIRLGEATRADMVADNLLLTEDGERHRAGMAMLPPALLDQPARIDAAAFLRGNLPVRGHPRVSFGFLKPLIRRAFLETHGLRYDCGMRFAEDFDLYLRCLLAGAVFWLTPEPGYDYRVHAGSLTARHGARDLVRLRALDRKLLEALEAAPREPDLVHALNQHLSSIEHRLTWALFGQSLARGRLRRAARIATFSRASALVVGRELVREAPRHLIRRACRRRKAPGFAT